MQFIIALIVIVVPLIAVAIVVAESLTVEPLGDGYPSASLTHRAYNA